MLGIIRSADALLTRGDDGCTMGSTNNTQRGEIMAFETQTRNVADATLTVEHVGYDSESHWQYRWTVSAPSAHATGSDLYSGAAGMGADHIMGTLLAFLSACAEASDGGENADLFPADVRQWAQDNSDEIAVAWFEAEV